MISCASVIVFVSIIFQNSKLIILNSQLIQFTPASGFHFVVLFFNFVQNPIELFPVISPTPNLLSFQPPKEKGTYVGPTVIDYVKPEMAVAREEIFGPVISIMRTNTVDEALAIENANPYGNAASVFTQNGGLARYIIDHASAGMICVNVGVPVPREPFSFGGWNESKFGVGDITGKSSIGFWTKLKKSTTKWNPEAGVNWMS